jgi:hypothetical protein
MAKEALDLVKAVIILIVGGMTISALYGVM